MFVSIRISCRVPMLLNCLPKTGGTKSLANLPTMTNFWTRYENWATLILYPTCTWGICLSFRLVAKNIGPNLRPAMINRSFYKTRWDSILLNCCHWHPSVGSSFIQSIVYAWLDGHVSIVSSLPNSLHGKITARWMQESIFNTHSDVYIFLYINRPVVCQLHCWIHQKEAQY